MAQAPVPPPDEAGGSDPSMDDILASIRRILSDEEKAAKTAAPAENIFVLDPSMMVEDQPAPQPPDAPDSPHETQTMAAPEPPPDTPEPMPEPPARVATQEPAREPSSEPPERTHEERTHDQSSLVAPEAAAAAATAVGALMRTLVAERSASVQRGGPTIEDVVREEIRPLLKQWLDAHLPALVERLVRAEIERVVGRATN